MEGGSQSDTIKSAQAMGETLREQLGNARKAPEKELGISKEDLIKRKQEAMKPRTFSTEDAKAFEVRSSTRAQQIMSAGLAEKQRDKRRRELKGSMNILRKFQYVLSFLGVGLIAWMTMQFLYPQYCAVQERNNLMAHRFERAQESLKKLADDPSRQAKVNSKDAFVRVVRLDEKGNIIGELKDEENRKQEEKKKRWYSIF